LLCSPSFIGIKPKVLSSYTFSPHQTHSLSFPKRMSQPSSVNPAPLAEADTDSSAAPSLFDYHSIDQKLIQNIVYDALVWSTLHCLLVGDKSVQVKLCHSFVFSMLLGSCSFAFCNFFYFCLSHLAQNSSTCLHFS